MCTIICPTYLPQTFLACPDRCMNNLQEQLSSSGIEDKDGSIYGFGGQVALKCLMNCNSVYIGVINKPTKQNRLKTGNNFIPTNITF